MFNISISGDTEVKRKLNKISGEIKDLKPAFTEMKSLLIAELRRNFDTKGSSFGTPWAARKYPYAWAILQKTGKMKNSWQDIVTSHSMIIFNTTPYATYHQHGTRHLPARPIVGISQNMLQVITRIVIKHIKKQL